MTEREPGRGDEMDAIARKAAEHGINVFHGMLEDDNEHYEDALRTGMLAAASEALRDQLAGAVDEAERLREAFWAWESVALAAENDPEDWQDVDDLWQALIAAMRGR